MSTNSVNFGQTLALLRKEKNISQKQAAADLGVSQALLSHYEKGIRECGLEFLVRAADYYDVSCDFLLGRSPQKTGAVLTIDDIPDSENDRPTGKRPDFMALMQKKLIIGTLNVLFDQLSLLRDSKLTMAISGFMNMALYRCYRMLFAMPKNGPQLFRDGRMLTQAKADAAMRISEAQANAIVDAYASGKEENPIPVLTNALLEEHYPRYATSVLNIIKNTEEQLH